VIPTIARIKLGEEDVKLLDELVRAYPKEEIASDEAATISWVEDRIQHIKSNSRLSAGFRKIRRALKKYGPHAVLITGAPVFNKLPGWPDGDGIRVDPGYIVHVALTYFAGRPYGADYIRGGLLRHLIQPKPDARNNTASSLKGFELHADGASNPDTAPGRFSLYCVCNNSTATFLSTTNLKDIGSEGISRKDWDRLTERVFDIYHKSNDPDSGGPRNIAVLQLAANGSLLRVNYYGEERIGISSKVPSGRRDRYKRALRRFIKMLERNAVEVILEPGNVLIARNFLVLHGRRASTNPGDRLLCRLWHAPEHLEAEILDPDNPGRILTTPLGQGAATD